ncbi:MAG: hypothetical protein PVF51_06565 [Nitrospirota bacterium]|jgi:hypothetical protein
METLKETAGTMKGRITATLTFVSVALAAPAWAGLDHELRQMSETQHQVLMRAIAYGAPHDLGYTLAAIAWQESHVGSVPVNITDPSFGPFHGKMDTVMSRAGVKDTAYNRNVIAAKLLSDFDFAASMAVRELLFWKKVHRGNWRKMVRSYNAGYNYRSKSATRYVQNIADKIRAIKRSFGSEGDALDEHLKYLKARYYRGVLPPIHGAGSGGLLTVNVTSNLGM